VTNDDKEVLVKHIIRLRLEAGRDGDEGKPPFSKLAQTWYENQLRSIYPELRADVARAWRELEVA
jgi:hypothetical protein